MKNAIKTINLFTATLTLISTFAAAGDLPSFKDCPECPEMISLPGGRFKMGTTGKNAAEDNPALPAHAVEVKSFAIGKFEITQDEWHAVMGTRPGHFKNGKHPVEQVTWKFAKEFTRKLSEKTGKSYRLPTEAEWEYAARAGQETDHYFGTNDAALGEYAWFDDNSDESTHPVGQRKPNAFGLYDMYGNVWEWLEDCWNHNYNGAPTDGSAWLAGDCSQRIARGGTWYSKPASVSSAARAKFASELRYSTRGGGLRVVREQ